VTGEMQLSKKEKTIRFRVAYFDSEVEPYTETVDNERQETTGRGRPKVSWLAYGLAGSKG